MKTKFVNVWDNRRMGYIGYIILQVEESDTFLTEKNFNPGYKFIVQAWYNHVGAAGGHKFIPAYGESVQEKTQKIMTNEADVLGLYLSGVDDIYDIPNELHTEKFWGILYSKTDNSDEIELEFPCENFYKVAYIIKSLSWNQYIESIDTIHNLLAKDFDVVDEAETSKLKNNMEKQTEMLMRMNVDFNKEHFQVYYGYIDKKTLKLKWEYYVLGSKEAVINKYLWEPHEELPVELWEEVKKRNSILAAENDEDIILSDCAELYYSV